ncbi:TPA: hypothetical protein N0F65_010994 [Lagenidium giganteum]|uniref:EGF-like domain-containing protein n=1 Tax=Lagenidium giganteum TaxID=4803 RepID=A0AAV2ZA59_9STRA|nr:TPA: hypothetical protein N0F65_010994 [Lagenidium giganteum]
MACLWCICFSGLVGHGRGASLLACNVSQETQDNLARWSLLGGLAFSRDSHAAAVFQDKIWIVGGVSTSYYTKRLEQTTSRSDVVYSADGIVWSEVFDEAPFRRRFGHSLTAFEDGVDGVERLVLLGGFSPDPATDVWTSDDGFNWVEVTQQQVPWTGRGWHCSVVFASQLWVLGGSPLNSQVWSTRSVIHGPWQQHADAPWPPRAAHACASHRIVTNVTEGDDSIEEVMFVTGGWDGTSLPDVWRFDTTGSWTLLQEAAPWRARAWHSLVSFDSRVPADVLLGPRLWLLGGGIVGQGIDKMVPFSDVWYTRDGVHWIEASSDASGISTADWSMVTTRDKQVCTGKWGHAVVPFYRNVTRSFYCGPTCVSENNATNLSGQAIAVCHPHTSLPDPPVVRTIIRQNTVLTATLYPDGCGLCYGSNSERYVNSTRVPALYLIAGNVGSQKVKDVFISNDAMLCERSGVLCSNQGACTQGGVCFCIDGKRGQFCDDNQDYQLVVAKSCFSEESIVHTDGDGPKALSDIIVGDRVLALDAYGQLVFSPVYYIPHDSDANQPTRFIRMRFTTQNGHTGQLEVTPDHLLFVLPTAEATTEACSPGQNTTTSQEWLALAIQKPARDVRAHDVVLVHVPPSAGSNHVASSTNGLAQDLVQPARVQQLQRIARRSGGLTLYTLTGNVFVDGVLCSNFADVYPVVNTRRRDLVAFVLFAPHRAAFTWLPLPAITVGAAMRWLMDRIIQPCFVRPFWTTWMTLAPSVGR